MQQEQDQRIRTPLKSPSQTVISPSKQEDPSLSRQSSDIKDKQKTIVQNGKLNVVQIVSENSSHIEAKGSLDNTVLVQSELIPISDQMRLISYPPNQPFQSYQPAYPQGAFIPINAQQLRQHPYPYPGPFLIPQQQYMPNWIHQSQHTQGRMQDQRSNTHAINSHIQLQPQGTQSQKSIGLKQAQVRIPLIERGNNKHSVSKSPAKIVFNYNANTHPAIIVKPGSQPPQTVIPQQTQPLPKPQPSQQTSVTNEETIVWEQRYFLIIERFELHYTQFDTITKDYIFLQQIIENTDNPDELQHLKGQSRKLLNIITQTQQQLTDIVHQNKQILGESTNWKAKYEQLLSNFSQFQESSARTTQEQSGRLEQLQKKLAESERQNKFLLNSNEELGEQYEKKQEEIALLNQQIAALEEKLKQTGDQSLYELQAKEYMSELASKAEEIHQLSNTIQSLQTNQLHPSLTPTAHTKTNLNKCLLELAQSQKLIHTLRQENQSLQSTMTQNTQQLKDYITRIEECIVIYQTEVIKQKQEINNYQSQIEENLKVIDKLNKMTDMRSSNVLSQNALSSEQEAQIRRLKHQIRVKEDTSDTDSKIFASRIQELIDKLKMQGNEKDACVTTLQEKISLLESDLNKKDGTIRNLRDRILELEQEKRIKQLDTKYLKKPTESSMGDSIDIAVLKRQLKERTNEIQELQAQIAEYKRITNEYEDGLSVKKHEINNLKRQLDGSSNTESEMAKLNELLNRRNAEIIDLKNRSFELQKVSNMNELLRQQNLNLNESLKRKHAQLTEFSDKIYLLQKRNRELQANKGTSPTVTHLNDENELLESAVNKKDQEIAKLRQNNQLLLSNVDALELELEKHKARLTSGGKLYENEKNDLRLKLTQMEGKLQDYQRKITGLEEVRAILQEQVATFTSEVHAKNQNIQKYQLELTQQRAKARSFQSQSQSLLAELEQLRRKLRQLQRKTESLQKDLQFQTDKKKQLNSSKKHEAINLNNKCLDLQNTIKNKDAKIKDLQKTIQTLNFKIRNFDNNIEQMDYLKHKITEYEGKINTLNNFSRPFSRFTDMQPTQVFERKVIYQLKMENEALKKQLGINLTKSVKTVNVLEIPERDNSKPEVKQRLNDFNKKLEEIIGEHLPNISNELYNQYERDRKLLIEKHKEETAQLKAKINELQQSQFSRPSQQALETGQIKRRKTFGNVQNVFTEQLQFYREKNQELQERVKDHIRVNKELKESIDTLMRGHSDEHSLQYYKDQIEKNNEVITALQNKLKKANEELKTTEEENERLHSRIVADDSVEIDNRLPELERKHYQLRFELEQAEREKAIKAQLVEDQERQIKKLKAQIEQFKVLKDQSARAFTEKESQYQSEITKLSNKLRITQSEISLLTETASKVKGHESNELKITKLKVVQLTQQTKRGKARVQELIISQEKYQREVAKWQNQNKTLLAEIQRLKDINESSIRRNKQNENELLSLKITATEYESKLRLKEANNDNFTYKEAQYRQEITRINNQSKLLQTEIDRTIDFTQRKIVDKDNEIAKLKNVIIEKNQQIHEFEERVDQLKVLSYRSNETAQEIFNFKQEINQLKISLNAKSKESENRLREIQQLHASLQTLEDELKETKRTADRRLSEINSAYLQLQDQNRQFKKKNETITYELNTTIATKTSELNLIISELQLQIREAQGKLFDSNATIRALEYQYNDLRQITKHRMDQLNSTINYLQDQARGKDNELNQLQERFNQLEYQLQALQRGKDERAPEDLSSHQMNSLRTRIIVLETQLTELAYDKDSQIVDLNITISTLRRQIQQILANGPPSFQPANHNSHYFSELLRSILIEVDVLLNEDTIPREYLAKRIAQQIGIGLKECSKWNETS